LTIASPSRLEVNVVPLNDVAHFIRGVTFKPEDVVPVGTPGSVACMRTKNVQATIDLADVWALPSVLIRRDDQLVAPGDLLVSTANSWNLVGKCCWVPTLPWPTTFGGFISVLRPDPGMVYPRYLFHWFGSQHTQEAVRSFGQRTTSISNLNIERTLALQIPLPPLAAQRRIADVLDKVDGLRVKRRTALAGVDAIAQSMFEDMFGDPDKYPPGTLESVAELRRGPFGGALRKEIFVDAGYRVYEQSNAIQDDFNTGRYFIDATKFASMRTFAVEPDDLIVSCSGTLGRVAIVPPDAAPGVINQALLRVRPKADRVTPLFLKMFLASSATQSALTGLGRGTGLQNFPPMEEVRALRVPVPPLPAQHHLAARMSVLSKMKEGMAASLAQLDDLFASLQHRAFRGEL